MAAVRKTGNRLVGRGLGLPPLRRHGWKVNCRIRPHQARGQPALPTPERVRCDDQPRGLTVYPALAAHSALEGASREVA